MYGIFKSASKATRPGLTEADLDFIQLFGFHLVSRQDGVDRRSRPSAWLLYQRLSPPRELKPGP